VNSIYLFIIYFQTLDFRMQH